MEPFEKGCNVARQGMTGGEFKSRPNNISKLLQRRTKSYSLVIVNSKAFGSPFPTVPAGNYRLGVSFSTSRYIQCGLGLWSGIGSTYYSLVDIMVSCFHFLKGQMGANS